MSARSSSASARRASRLDAPATGVFTFVPADLAAPPSLAGSARCTEPASGGCSDRGRGSEPERTEVIAASRSYAKSGRNAIRPECLRAGARLGGVCRTLGPLCKGVRASARVGGANVLQRARTSSSRRAIDAVVRVFHAGQRAERDLDVEDLVPAL